MNLNNRSLLSTQVNSQAEPDALPLHDRLQIALAIADESALKGLLLNCTPPLTQPHQIGNIQSSIGVPLAGHKVIDGVIRYEEIYCTLIESTEDLRQGIADFTRRVGNERGYLDLTRCESETQTLGHGLSLSQSLALLAHYGFTPAQIRSILHLPYEAWHKTWWYSLDAEGRFTVPFLRLMRTLRYPDGTYTTQYKDFYAQEKPPCFSIQEQQVLVEINVGPLSFRRVLEKINGARQHSGIAKVVLVCDRISELEAKALISQGISLYAATELLLPARANCHLCETVNCPLRGRVDSPVLTCERFSLSASLD